ncbi:MAG: orotidine-5'-phosphate decarboxylase [bacterium]
MGFESELHQRIENLESRLCVGFDPRPERIDGDVLSFLKRAVDAVHDIAAAVKPNIAYFEAMGVEGYEMLDELLDEIPESMPVILDVKRSDIPETQKYYKKAYFDRWDVDAVTLNPYMGFDSLEPFLEIEEKGIYLLGVTSNPGAQAMQLGDEHGTGALHRVIEMTRQTEYETMTGLVMGLTNLSESLIGFMHDVPLLLPGLGAQGGEVSILKRLDDDVPSMVNSSRSVLYGDQDRADGTGIEGRAKDYRERIADAFGR